MQLIYGVMHGHCRALGGLTDQSSQRIGGTGVVFCAKDAPSDVGTYSFDVWPQPCGSCVTCIRQRSSSRTLSQSLVMSKAFW